jgi:hypothetical protein
MPMNEPTDDLDALGLIAARQNTVIRFGSTEVGTALVRAQMKNALNQMATATFVFDFDLSAEECDYFSGISVASGTMGSEIPQFTGSVISATPEKEGVEVEAISAVSLSENIIPGMVTRGIPPFEMVYVLARSSGIRDENLNIQGISELPLETFEVLAPIHGVIIDRPTPFGGITLVPADNNIYSISELDATDDLKADFHAPAYALALITASRALDAEGKGLAAIDLALAWLTTQLRFGLIHLPDETLLAFNRRESLAQPNRGDVVFVRGLTTLRQWLRRPRSAKQALLIDIAQTKRYLEYEFPHLTLQDEQALRAFSRATREPDALAQIHALWEAIEFYASEVSVDKLFTKANKDAIRDALPTLTEAQKERVNDLINQLNNSPLSVRLKKALDNDKAPITDGEMELLWKLRKLRNDVVHGRKSELPTPEDVEYATSIVSRMLVYRVARLRNDEYQV